MGKSGSPFESRNGKDAKAGVCNIDHPASAHKVIPLDQYHIQNDVAPVYGESMKWKNRQIEGDEKFLENPVDEGVHEGEPITK
jgi:hypothetical protein